MPSGLVRLSVSGNNPPDPRLVRLEPDLSADQLQEQNQTKSEQILIKLDETWTKRSHQWKEYIPKRFFQKDQVFIADFEKYEKVRVWTRTHKILKSKVIELMD